jgi:hypothetical protein
MAWTSSLFILNFLTIYTFLLKLNVPYLHLPGNSNVAGIITFLGIFTLNYFLFVHRKRYQKIEELFSIESYEDKLNHTVLIVGYAIITFVFFAIVGFMHPFNI